MHRWNKILISAAIAATLQFSVSAGAFAQGKPEICTEGPNETLLGCSKKVDAWFAAKSVESESSEKIAAVAHEEAAKLNTGPSAASPGSGASTTNDYIPFIQALIGSSPAAEDSADNLGLEFSNFLPIPDGFQHKVAIQLVGSSVYAPLDQALLEAELTAEREMLKNGIASSDDISIIVSASPDIGDTGRNPSLHPKLFEALLAASVGSNARFELAQRAYHSLLKELREKTRTTATPFDEGQLDSEAGFGAVPDADRELVIFAYEQMEKASHSDLVIVRENLRNSGFYTALELLSNNPQWNFVANYRARDEVTGPDELSASVTYEIGWPSLKSARKEMQCGDDTCLASRFSSFLTSSSTKKMRNAAPRFSFSLSYTERARYEFLLPSSTFQYSRESSQSIVGSLSFGMFLSGSSGDAARVRMDLSASYEDVSDDPAKHDRGVANLTFTYPVGTGMFLSIGAVYATRPEYRGEVDKEFNARAGLLYKFAGAD